MKQTQTPLIRFPELPDFSIKHDKGKLQYGLIPPAIIKELAKIYTHGANKYGKNTWENVELYRYVDAFFRHFEAWRSGEEIDPDSGEYHLSHALWNLGTIFMLSSNLNSVPK